jgi:hypothetical protein
MLKATGVVAERRRKPQILHESTSFRPGECWWNIFGSWDK